MFRKIFLTMSLGAALLPIASAGSQEFIENVLEEQGIKYSTSDGKVFTEWSDSLVLASWVDAESAVLYISGFSCTGVPMARWSQAYEKLNELIKGHNGCIFLDSDGDVRANFIVDLDDMNLSRAAYLASLKRALLALSAAREEMMKVRYQSEN